eukprot:15458907-Alexandrium_andersonii.AAC.1
MSDARGARAPCCPRCAPATSSKLQRSVRALCAMMCACEPSAARDVRDAPSRACVLDSARARSARTGVRAPNAHAQHARVRAYAHAHARAHARTQAGAQACRRAALTQARTRARPNARAC